MSEFNPKWDTFTIDGKYDDLVIEGPCKDGEYIIYINDKKTKGQQSVAILTNDEMRTCARLLSEFVRPKEKPFKNYRLSIRAQSTSFDDEGNFFKEKKKMEKKDD